MVYFPFCGSVFTVKLLLTSGLCILFYTKLQQVLQLLHRQAKVSLLVIIS